MNYKIGQNGIITMLGESQSKPEEGIEITKEKYNELLTVCRNAPQDTLETKYFLSNKTEQYEGRETTHEEKAMWFFNAVMNETMTLEDVPEDYRSEVEVLIPPPEVNERNLNKAYKEGVQEA